LDEELEEDEDELELEELAESGISTSAGSTF
jgi:hypothetical protein